MSKKIVIPDGMLKAAGAGSNGVDPCGFYLVGPLRAALEWLAENPMVPTLDQYREMLASVNYQMSMENIQKVFAEWQRRMFLAPDPPEASEDILDMILKYPKPAHECIIEAYRRGKNYRDRHPERR